MEVTNSILSPTHEPARHAFELRTPENREDKRPINLGRSDAARPDLVRARRMIAANWGSEQFWARTVSFRRARKLINTPIT